MKWKMDVLTILKGVVLGAIAGAISAGLGYLKTENPEGGLENFDKVKFSKTVIVGMIIGGITGAGFGNLDQISAIIGGEFSLDPIWVKTFLLTLITKIADEIVKIIWRRSLVKLLKK